MTDGPDDARLRARDGELHRPARQPRPARPHRPSGRADRDERQVGARRRGGRPPRDACGPRGGGSRRGAVSSATTEQRGIVTRLVASRDALVAARSEKTAHARVDPSPTVTRRSPRSTRSSSRAPRWRRASGRRSSAPRLPAVVAPSGSGVLGWPVSGPGDERLRIALGADARGNRHRGRRRHARRGGRRRDGHLRGLDGRLRQSRRRRPRERPLDRVRAQLVPRRLGRTVGRSGRDRSPTRAAPATRPGRTSTSRCGVNGSAVDPLGYLYGSPWPRGGGAGRLRSVDRGGGARRRRRRGDPEGRASARPGRGRIRRTARRAP